MFRRIANDLPDDVAVVVDGVAVRGRRGDTVAALLLAAGKISFRISSVSGLPRGPYCMMGSCFECLVRINGVADRQGCIVEIADGMTVETQSVVGARA